MQASLADTNLGNAPRASSQPSADEHTDMALARAITESEKEELERQRRQNQQVKINVMFWFIGDSES